MDFLEFVQDNWVLITVLLGVIIQMIQLVTKHFSEYAGVKKVGLFLVELLSIFKSREVEGTILKLPLTSKAPDKLKKETQ